MKTVTDFFVLMFSYFQVLMSITLTFYTKKNKALLSLIFNPDHAARVDRFMGMRLARGARFDRADGGVLTEGAGKGRVTGC